jgi:phage host-nuclease inhibitor protein Gam
MPQKIKTTLKNFDEIDQKLLELAKHQSFIQSQEADMNDKIQDIRKRYDNLTAHINAVAKQISTDIENFCLLNRQDFEKSKSKEYAHGIVGFRKSPPKILQLNRKYSWETIIELLKKMRLGMFIRKREEVDKEAILAAIFAKEITDEKLTDAGLKIDQSEKFSITIKWNEITLD